MNNRIPDLTKLKTAVRTLGEHFKGEGAAAHPGAETKEFADALAAYAMLAGFIAGIENDTQLRDYVLGVAKRSLP